MKLNQLKRIIENEIKTLKEQAVRPNTGGVTSTGLSDAQYAQIIKEFKKVGFTIEGTGPNAKCSILLDLLVKLILRMILNQIINDIMDEINLEENHN